VGPFRLRQRLRRTQSGRVQACLLSLEGGAGYPVADREDWGKPQAVPALTRNLRALSPPAYAKATSGKPEFPARFRPSPYGLRRTSRSPLWSRYARSGEVATLPGLAYGSVRRRKLASLEQATIQPEPILLPRPCHAVCGIGEHTSRHGLRCPDALSPERLGSALDFGVSESFEIVDGVNGYRGNEPLSLFPLAA